MSKKYQTTEFDASVFAGEMAVPEQVNVAMGEIAADLREGLLALAVGAGLQVMGQLMEADVTAVCGPRGKHDTERTATRHGSEVGSVTLGAVDECDRVDDRLLPRARQERQTLAHGQMALRWCAAGMVEASKQLRRVNGHLHLAALRASLERHVAAETVGADCNTQDVSAA